MGFDFDLSLNWPAAVLAADGLGVDEIVADRADAFVDFHLFIADAGGIESGGGLHRDQGHELEHVVLDHVAGGAALVVVAGPVVGADGFADGDLHVIDVFVIPDRLEDRVGEAHHHEVLDGFLAEVMVDAEDLLFLEIFEEDGIEVFGGFVVPAEGLFDDDALEASGAVGAAVEAFTEAGDDSVEDFGRRGDVEEAVAAGVVGFVELLEAGGEAGVVFGGIVGAGDVIDVGLHAFPDVFVDGLPAGVFLDGLVAVLAVLGVDEGRAVFFFLGARVADEDEFVGDEAFAAEFVDGGDEFELGEIAGGAEDDDCAGYGVGHREGRILWGPGSGNWGEG